MNSFLPGRLLHTSNLALGRNNMLHPGEASKLNDIERFRQERTLISVRREKVDPFCMQGFILGASEELVLLQYVYDFNLDGLMVLRAEDISEIVRSKTDEFQQSLLESEGVMARIPFDTKIDLTNWHTAISDLLSRFRLLIVECELMEEPEFSIGEILEVRGDKVVMRTFTGAANWVEVPVDLLYEEITCCQANTNYTNFYQRYFDRNAPGQ
jgi:hypothetical protein